MVCVSLLMFITASCAAVVNQKPDLGVSTRASTCAGGVGLPALPVEDRPGGCRRRLLGGPPAAAALLAARVGREGHLHAHLAEGGAHAPAQNHGRRTSKPPEMTRFSVTDIRNDRASVEKKTKNPVNAG